jgi:hypothetical protein
LLKILARSNFPCTSTDGKSDNICQHSKCVFFNTVQGWGLVCNFFLSSLIIILKSTGKRGFLTNLTGNTTARVARHSKKPVLVLRRSRVSKLIPGIILFLYGIEQFSHEVRIAAGEYFRNLIQRMTRTPVRGTVVGALVTALVQSSMATSVITVGLVNSGISTEASTSCRKKVSVSPGN